MKKYIMSELGDALLKTLQDLEINIGNVNPNVIKAWFDTDCEKTKYFLQWLCTLSSRDNCLSYYEIFEYDNMNPKPDNLETEVENIEKQYPGIFEDNKFENKLRDADIEALTKENIDIEEEINKNNETKTRLKKELLKAQSEENQSILKKNLVYEQCLQKSTELDAVNAKIYQQISTYETLFVTHDFTSNLLFNNSLNLIEIEDQFKSVIECLPLQNNLENYMEISVNKSFLQNLNTIENRIIKVKRDWFDESIKNYQLEQVLQFLETFNPHLIFAFDECASVEVSVECKRRQQSALRGRINDMAKKYAKTHINQARLYLDKQELFLNQAKLKRFTKIGNLLAEIYANYSIACVLCSIETEDIKTILANLKKINTYINKDLRNSIFRSDAMEKVIQDYAVFNAKKIEDKLQIFEDVATVLNKSEGITIVEMVDEIDALKAEILTLEQLHFVKDLKRQLKPVKLAGNIEMMNRFLMCGPTTRIVLIPTEMHRHLRKISVSLEDQGKRVQMTMDLRQKAFNKRCNDPKLRAIGQLWIYFLTDPAKLHATLNSFRK